MHCMDATYCYVARSFFLSLSVGHTGELSKNGWTDRDVVGRGEVTSTDPRNHVLDGVEISPTGRGSFRGCPAHWKESTGSLCCGVRSKRDQSVVNNGTTRGSAAAESHHIEPWKIRHPVMRPFVKIVWPLVFRSTLLNQTNNMSITLHPSIRPYVRTSVRPQNVSSTSRKFLM